jgi:hypothetical protein
VVEVEGHRTPTQEQELRVLVVLEVEGKVVIHQQKVVREVPILEVVVVVVLIVLMRRAVMVGLVL